MTFLCQYPTVYTFAAESHAAPEAGRGLYWIAALLAMSMLASVLYIWFKTRAIKEVSDGSLRPDPGRIKQALQKLGLREIEGLLGSVKKKNLNRSDKIAGLIAATLILAGVSFPARAQTLQGETALHREGGVIITLILVMIPILTGLLLMAAKISAYYRRLHNKKAMKEAGLLLECTESDPEIIENLENRRKQLRYTLSRTELSGTLPPSDEKGMVLPDPAKGLPLVASKKRAEKRPAVDARLSRIVLWYIITATIWLIFGTTVGEYVGIKFVAPDADQLSWLSFGRLRPVHTNSVFWGWASLGMLALGTYIVPRVGNTTLYSYKLAWWALGLTNLTVVLGTLTLMAGINNGGGEFREYIWPVMLPFAAALILSLYNFYMTVATRKTKEIYISNWYMIAALMFVLVISVIAYLPFWQNGLGETIIQGYYMHQGVGMWFMLFTLGIVYYFLPQQLNKPIYSYSLGILAFWTQILFYTLIGTHHFVFSSIPWWLQTVAIVGSAGMVIPVAAGTANFLLTFKGAWHKIAGSYTLPFFIVGIIFYFTGSMQGTAESFRTTNLLWHFTDFTVAHSHLTMYGIICFFLWAGIYAVMPRLTGTEPPQILVGAHFWLALVGLLFYSFPLMYGGTLKGLSWMEGKPFIESVVLMAPHWLWRAIGGSLMWLSHLFFAVNIYKMYMGGRLLDTNDALALRLNEQPAAETQAN